MADFKMKIRNAEVTDEALERLFLHPWVPLTEEQKDRCAAIRLDGLRLARVILANAPASADQSAAIRKVREAVTTAVAAVCCAEPKKKETADPAPAGVLTVAAG